MLLSSQVQCSCIYPLGCFSIRGKAAKAAEALGAMLSSTATAIRDGKQVKVEARELVSLYFVFVFILLCSFFSFVLACLLACLRFPLSFVASFVTLLLRLFDHDHEVVLMLSLVVS